MAQKFWVGAPKFRVGAPKFRVDAHKFGIGSRKVWNRTSYFEKFLKFMQMFFIPFNSEQ